MLWIRLDLGTTKLGPQSDDREVMHTTLVIRYKNKHFVCQWVSLKDKNFTQGMYNYSQNAMEH